MSIIDKFHKHYELQEPQMYTIEEYFDLCKKDKMAYATAAERMVKAIGDRELVNTANDPRLSRIFSNRTISVYPAFKDFHGMEDTIEQIVGFFQYAAQGLEERKQILYLLGPVGGGKSSLAERLKELMEKYPVYCLATKDGKVSPVFESPLGLFNTIEHQKELSEEYGIDMRYFGTIMSPWAIKRLKEYRYDISNFRVMRLMPSKLEQIAIMKTEPGDENNQDISTLVGKVDIRMLEHFSQNDTDAYSYSGGLCRANQGLLEFVEMFKAPPKVLHPLLTATQEGNYVGTEAISAIPFQGIVLAHSNESEWQSFKNNKNNEAFLDRICVVKVPYCLRVRDEIKIYEKLVENSGLANAPCAPRTLRMLAEFAVLSRLRDHENSTPYSKMRVYDGEKIREFDANAKTLQEYRDFAGVDEGMDGISTRFCYKILSKTFNFSPDEVAADPVHLLYTLEQAIKKEQFPEDKEQRYLSFIKNDLSAKYAEFIANEIQKAYLESYGDYGQNLFNRYLQYADAWLQDQEFKDPDTGLLMNRSLLNEELEKMEKPAGIANPKDFRNEVVTFCFRQKARTGEDVKWTSYATLRDVIEKRMFSKIEDLLPVISFDEKNDKEMQRKHDDFVARMEERGYTPKQIRRLVDWYARVRKSS